MSAPILTVPLAALLGLATGLGVLLIAVGLTRSAAPELPVDRDDRTEPPWLARFVAGASRRRVAVCLGVGIVVAVVTRWPVAAVLSSIAAWVLPQIIGPDRDHDRRLARIDAIATWTESLRDNLAAAAGLEQALDASAIEAPEPIREEVTLLTTRLRRGWRLPAALRMFAAELADPTADLVVAGLLMAARGGAGQLADVLGELAASARAKVASRQRIAAGRQRTRTSARVIVGATLAMAALLTVINRGYLNPFDTAFGQLVLAAAGACFGVAFWWLAWLMRDKDTSRILARIAEPASEAGSARDGRTVPR